MTLHMLYFEQRSGMEYLRKYRYWQQNTAEKGSSVMASYDSTTKENKDYKIRVSRQPGH